VVYNQLINWFCQEYFYIFFTKHINFHIGWNYKCSLSWYFYSSFFNILFFFFFFVFCSCFCFFFRLLDFTALIVSSPFSASVSFSFFFLASVSFSFFFLASVSFFWALVSFFLQFFFLCYYFCN